MSEKPSLKDQLQTEGTVNFLIIFQWKVAILPHYVVLAAQYFAGLDVKGIFKTLFWGYDRYV